MSARSATLLESLDKSKSIFDARREQRILTLLNRLSRLDFTDAKDLLRYHESLLFILAYPPSAKVLKSIDSELSAIADRVELLQNEGADIASLEVPEASGMAGTSVTDTFSYYIVRWLSEKYPRQISFNWEWFEDENRLAETWPRLMPLLAEDASVEANVPYREWLQHARGKEGEVQWLIEKFRKLPLADDARAELYDGQKLYVTWVPPFRATRTGMKFPVRKIFYHRTQLIQRRDVKFGEELERPLSGIRRLNEKQGAKILNLAKETSTVRYRELYGFTHGDPRRVLHVNLGRGVDLLISGVPPIRRLPWRAYHAAMIFKNGIAVGYFEGLSLFERMESGFNLYYTFREGETAWLYARTLNVFRQLLGVTTFTLDPYQIGHENEEGIESGAFWFYRKLGFRSTRKDLMRLTEREEAKLAARKSYRTPASVLRKLAAASMVFELKNDCVGDWDKFQLRDVGFAVQRRMASKHGGDSERFRKSAMAGLSVSLRIDAHNWPLATKKVLGDFAVVLGLVDLSKWSSGEKQLLIKIIKAKSGSDESQYLKLMQRHERLRQELIRLGSPSSVSP